MSHTVVLYDVAEGIATITLNRPEKRNAVTFELAAELRAALEEARADPEVRCV